MTIRLISGIPGSGKTLYAVNELKKIVEDNATSDEPRKIYSDITGLKFEGIEPPPIDWRQTPPRSLLIYDEAQLRNEFKANRGASPYAFVNELTIHRKSGHEIWFITQDPKRLHNEVLGMVELHHHLERPYGAKLATIYKYRGAERNPSARSVKERAENKTVFTYDKSLYDLYESSQVDDGIKFRLPKELTFWLVGLVAVGTFFYFQVTSDGTKKYVNAAMGKTEEVAENQPMPEMPPLMVDDTHRITTDVNQAQHDTQNRRLYLYQNWLPQDYELIKSEPVLQVRGVIQMGDKCHAYNVHGDLLNLSKEECTYYLAEVGRVHKSDQAMTMTITTTQDPIAPPPPPISVVN